MKKSGAEGDPRTVADMTLEEQVERLARQRNALWDLIQEFSSEYAFHDDGEKEERTLDDLVESATSGIVEDGKGEKFFELSIPIGKIVEVGRAADKLIEDAEEIIGNTYAVEGVHPLNGDVGDADGPKFAPYLAAAKGFDKW